MKFTLSWLKQFLETDLGSEEISNALTAIGLEVEDVIDKRSDLQCFKVAKIVEVTKHPEADKLNICKVDNGSEILQIICGASNVKPEMKIVLASIGDVIPTNGLKIEKRKLRGVESNGMICSAEEIGLEDSSEGIMELPANLRVGEKLIDQVPQLADIVVEISLTPNRGDCFGVYGVARDLSAYGCGSLRVPNIPNIKSTISKSINIEVDNISACPLYISRYFADVQNTVSPLVLSGLLRSIDEQSISALVDVTNYQMISYNRPMHIYDADKIVGELVVRSAKDKEKFVALGGKEYMLEEGDIVVADDEKICSLAGIIGGEDSKCDMGTKNILLEVAIFDKKTVGRTARKYGIETGSKHRNERGLDYNFTVDAVELASQQIVDLCGGQAGDIKVVGLKQENKNVIDFDISLVSKISGLDISKTEVISILKKLGFELIKDSKNNLGLSIPSWRHDINIAEDVVEEIIRIFGYDNIQSLPLEGHLALNNDVMLKDQKIVEVKKLLAASGYNELVTWSFMSSKLSEKLGVLSSGLKVKNPISDHLDQLRSSIIPNLLQAVKNNKLRSFDILSFFETGPVYQDEQRLHLTAVRAGYNVRDGIYGDKRQVDFFDLKKDVLHSLEPFGILASEITFCLQDEVQWYHPGKSAFIKQGKNIIGYVGEVHPGILKKFKIGGSVSAFELFIDEITTNKQSKSITFSDYQIVEKDIAFVVDQNLPVGDIEKSILLLKNQYLKDAYIFDVYSDDEQLGTNKKSVAFKLILQSNDKTLNKEEIDSIFADITNVVESQCKGRLRTF